MDKDFKTIDEIAAEIIDKRKPKKRGRPKKETEPKFIKINEERFNEERCRIITYFEKLSSRTLGPSEMISVLEDLDVIVETNGLSKDEILDQLRQELSKPRSRR